jgi:hypothetical protein
LGLPQGRVRIYLLIVDHDGAMIEPISWGYPVLFPRRDSQVSVVLLDQEDISEQSSVFEENAF